MSETNLLDLDRMPRGWVARTPTAADVPALVALTARHQVAAKGSASVDPETVQGNVIGKGSWTRRQVVVVDDSEVVRGWASVHDRAAGRTVVDVTVAPSGEAGDVVSEPVADALAAALFDWSSRVGEVLREWRGLDVTQLDSGAYADDSRQQRWLAGAGYHHTRSWLQMSRPVAADEARPGVLAAPREGVTVRRISLHENGMPLATDLQLVHQMLEESFADHFNSYRESFPEFLSRLREDPGHRWDHWWIAEVEIDGRATPGGALVSTILPPDRSGAPGSYVDYIGVHRLARGRGVAKALLHTVIRDAAERGHNRVGLEVDADSPTGADGLYHSLGWVTAYTTQSWHRELRG